jgi:hypothetical protein
MTEMVTSGSMSGDAKRSDGLLGESGYERRRSHQAPPVLHVAARILDSTSRRREFVSRRHEPASSDPARTGTGAGLLIQAAVGSGGGTGTPRGKRSGCAA